MKNAMTYQGYVGTVEYSEEDNCLFGRIAGDCMCLPLAAAVGIVDMVDCRPITRKDMYAAYCCEKEDGSDFDGEIDGYAWMLENPREIEPIAVKGQLRPWLWKGPELVLAPGWHKARFAWDEEI